VDGTLLFGVADRTVPRETEAPADCNTNRLLPAHTLKAYPPDVVEENHPKSLGPEAGDPDLLAALERLGHHPLEGPEAPLGLALGHPGLLRDPLDELNISRERVRQMQLQAERMLARSEFGQAVRGDAA
jgi:hypothetical protein